MVVETERQRNPWGESKRSALPHLRKGMSVEEIAKITDLTPCQIRNVRERARGRGELPPSTPEGTRRLRRLAMEGKPSPFKGHFHRLEAIAQMREKHRGRELTERERKQTALLVTARQVPRDLEKLTLCELYEKHEKALPCRGSKRAFLEIFYAARLCPNKNRNEGHPFVDMADFDRIYDEIDPRAFERWREEVTFICEQTLASSEKPRENNHVGEEGRFGRAAAFFTETGIEWPEN